MSASLLLALAVLVYAPNRVSRGDLVRPEPIRYVRTAEKVVALTYDDGPHPIYTPIILRTLRRLHVRATFFMIGARMEKWPGIVRETAADGHSIANHTYSHPKHLADANHAVIVDELRRCERVIESQTGRHNRLFRPPKGLLGRQISWLAGDSGCRVVLWSIPAYQHKARTPELMARHVLSSVRPGAIILMHDGSYRMRWRDVEATPLVIDGLRKRGYRFVTVPELLALESRRVAKLTH